MDRPINARLKKPEIPPYFVEKKSIMDIFEEAGNKNIYISAGPASGKSLAMASFVKDKNKVVWLNLSKFDTAKSIEEALCEAFGAENTGGIYDILAKYAKGYIVVLDNIDSCFDDDIFEEFTAVDDVRLFISSRKFNDKIHKFVKEDGVFISNEDFVFSDDEIAAICGTKDEKVLRMIDGYAGAAGFFALSRGSGEGEDLALRYIFKNVYDELENNKKRLVADTILAEKVPFGLCEYLYGQEYGIRIAEEMRGSYFVRFEDDSFLLHPMLKKAVINYVGFPEKAVNEKMLSFYEETEDYKNYIRYCVWLGRKDEAAKCLDLHGFELLDKGEMDFIEKTVDFIEDNDEGCFGIYALKGAVLILKGDYSKGYEFSLKGYEHFKDKADDKRFVYSSVFTSRALRNTSYLKEALAVINEADKARLNFELIYRYFIDAEKIAVLNDLGEFTDAYNTCIRGIEKASVKSDLRIKRLYERLSCSIYYYSKRLARALYAYEKSKEFENEDYWIKKRSEVYMYGLGALHIIGDRKRAIAEYAEKKKELIESGIIGEMWYGELNYLKMALYEESFGNLDKGFKDSLDAAEEFIKPLKNHYLHAEYFEVVKALYNGAKNGSVDEEEFYKLPEKISRLNFAASIECLCVYIKILVERNDVEKIIPTVDEIIEGTGGMLNVFFVNVVMDIALYCVKNGDKLKAEEYMSWVGENALEAGNIRDIDKTKLKVIELLSENKETKDNLEKLFIRCSLEEKSAYAELFADTTVWTGEDKKVKWRTTKTKEFMAYLVYMDGEGVSKNKIIESVWGEKADSTFTPIFNTTMYNLRKALSEDSGEAVKFENNVYFIDKTVVDTDFSYYKEAVKAFGENRNADNAFRVLSWVKPLNVKSEENEFEAQFNRKCFTLVKDAFEYLCESGFKDYVYSFVQNWEEKYGESFFLDKCREAVNK